MVPSTSAMMGKSTSPPANTSMPATAQLLTNPRGKIHRINKDGTVPTDNPFYDGAGPNWDSIWALGLRNPYRAYYDPPTGRLIIGDVGGNDYSVAKEEVNVGAAGANYGWPNSEGPCAAPCTSPDLLLSAQRPRRGDHRRIRLPRHAVPEPLPGQLLLRGLHAKLDSSSDLRCERQRHAVSSTSSPRMARSMARMATSCISRRGPTVPCTMSISGTPISVAPSAISKIRQNPLRPDKPGACRRGLRNPDERARSVDGQLFEQRLVRIPRDNRFHTHGHSVTTRPRPRPTPRTPIPKMVSTPFASRFLTA